jgi:hypothetical protein
MPNPTLEKRVDLLERRVNELATRQDLKVLSDQILQLGTEMRIGFSALREEIRAGDEETRRVLRAEIRAGDEESRRYMRMLYEDVVDRLGKQRG